MLATNTERQRLARELHDSVTQTLFSASMVAQTLPYLWGRDEEMRRGLDELSRLTTGALAEMRTMLVELRPTALETADLADLVSYLLKAMAGRTTIQYDLTIDGNWRPPPTVQIAAYRVVQEALNNVIKHAYATDVSVNIQRKVGTLQITINDNGLGFTMSDISADHFGLDIMNERAADIDAALDIHSKLGQGSTVSFFWSAPPV
jgi:signal transduction histidine kinase